MYEEIFSFKTAKFDGLKAVNLTGAYIGLNYPVIDNDTNLYRNFLNYDLSKNTIIQFTGRCFVSILTDEICYQIIYDGTKYGYVWQYDLKDWSTDIAIDNTVSTKAQNYLNELIVYNQQILENNLLCARGLELATETGVALPVEFRKQLYSLQSRLSTRNTKIKESGYVEDVEERTSPNFSLYNQSIINFMGNPGIGFVVTTTVAIIVICVIIAASAGIAWTLFKSMHTESKVDFSYSNDLLAELAKYLPPETFKKLMAENAANKKKADDAIAASSTGGVLSTLKYLAIGYLGFTVIDKFLQKRN